MRPPQNIIEELIASAAALDCCRGPLAHLDRPTRVRAVFVMATAEINARVIDGMSFEDAFKSFGQDLYEASDRIRKKQPAASDGR